MLAAMCGRILTCAGTDYESGVILVKDGSILDIGHNIPIPAECPVLDLSEYTIIPGMIDAHTHLGINEESIGAPGIDNNEVSETVLPSLRVIDGINPLEEGLQDAYSGGVTTTMVLPGSMNVIGGQTAIIKTHGTCVDDMVIRAPAGLKVALGENPKSKDEQRPSHPRTRMGIANLLRKACVSGLNYMQGSRNEERDLDAEVMAALLRGEFPIMAHAHRADDIITAVRICREFNLKLVIQHGTEAHRVAKYLAVNEVPVLVGSTFTSRVKVELQQRTYRTPAMLVQEGIKFALITDHPIIPINMLRLQAAVAAREGISENVALKAITIFPAEILGISHRVGSLEKGKDADFVALTGHPLDVRSKVACVVMQGQVIYKQTEYNEA